MNNLSIHARIQKVCQMGSNFDNIFLVNEKKGMPKIPLAGHHRPASETPLKWRFAGVPMVAQH